MKIIGQQHEIRHVVKFHPNGKLKVQSCDRLEGSAVLALSSYSHNFSFMSVQTPTFSAFLFCFTCFRKIIRGEVCCRIEKRPPEGTRGCSRLELGKNALYPAPARASAARAVFIRFSSRRRSMTLVACLVSSRGVASSTTTFFGFDSPSGLLSRDAAPSPCVAAF